VKPRAKSKSSKGNWRVRAAKLKQQRQRRIDRDAAKFEKYLAKYRQKVADSPYIQKADKKRIPQLSDSEFRMWLAEQNQKQKLRKATRRDAFDNRFRLPGNDPL